MSVPGDDSTMSTIGASAGSSSTARARVAGRRHAGTLSGVRLPGTRRGRRELPLRAWSRSAPARSSAPRSLSRNPVPPLRTFTPKPEDIQRAWHVIDADGLVLGRVATQVAALLQGKHKPICAPHVDTGDHVIVVNAAKLDVEPRKLADKQYYRHSGYPGGLTSESLEHLLARDPERVVRLAVKGMLPKTRLGRKQLRKLRVYAGPAHPHAAQQPAPFAIASKRTSAA